MRRSAALPLLLLFAACNGPERPKSEADTSVIVARPLASAPRSAVAAVPSACRLTLSADGDRVTLRRVAAQVQAYKYGTSTKLGGACDSLLVVALVPAPVPAPVPPAPTPTPVPTPTPTPAGAPELPRAEVDFAESAMPSNGPVVRVAVDATATQVQAALDAAVAGTSILFAPGQYVGNFVLRKPAGASATAWVRLATDTAAAPRMPRLKRVTPTTGANFAYFVSPTVAPALATASGVGGGYYVRLENIRLGAANPSPWSYGILALGSSDRLAQPTLAMTPSHITLDHVLIDLPAMYDARRCVAANAQWVGIVDSWLDGCHSNQGDAQAVSAINGALVLTIDNTRLGGSGENFMSGGGDPASVDMQPSDVTVRRSYLVKQLAWRRTATNPTPPGQWTEKNVFELKVARRVLVESSVLENSWGDAQNGQAYEIKSNNQDGTAPWGGTSDVTVRYTRVRNVSGFTALSGRPEANPADTLARVLLEQNWVTLAPGALQVQLGSGAKALTLRHNTVDGGLPQGAAFYFNSGTLPGFSALSNVFGSGGTYNWGYASAEGFGSGVAALTHYVPGWTASTIGGNCFLGANIDASPGDVVSATRAGCPAGAGADTVEVVRRTAGAVSGDWTAAGLAAAKRRASARRR